MSGNFILLFLAFWPMLGAFLSYLTGRRSKTARNLLADGIVILEFAVIGVLFTQRLLGGQTLSFAWEGFCAMGLHLELDGFRALYGCIAAFMWMMTTIFSREYFTHYRNRNRYYMFMLLTLGATMGVFLSADLYTTFIFFEVMSFTSYVWVAHEEKPAAMRAAETYLGVAVIGGLVMLMGIFLLYQVTGTLYLDQLLEASRTALASADDMSSSYLPVTIFGTGRAAIQAQLYLAGALMVFGFGAKAGMFPLHIWLPKAHPVAPAPSSALLSGILTKSGIFGILAVTCNIFRHDPYWGIVILLLGTVTMFGGALLAVFSVDFKRTLACSSMSQVGFILVGVGMQCLLGAENALAVRGSLLHMVNHSLIKLDLFMVAGVIYMNLHKLNLNEIRGFGRKKPLLMFAYLMGALGIGGIPLWNGYVSKTLLHESIVEYTELIEEAFAEVQAAGVAVWDKFLGFLPVITAEAEGEAMTLIGTYGFWKAIEWIFLISGGMTVAYMLKLFVAVFWEKNEDSALQKKYDAQTSYWNAESKFAIIGSAILLPILGFFPGLTMDKLADLGQGFMGGESPAHAVTYFSLGNLKGACISIAIGLALYFGVIRTLLMVPSEVKGYASKHYVDRWPKWLDLENLIYRPIVLVILPGICGRICEFFDAYVIDGPLKLGMNLATLLSRIGDSLVDGTVLLARRTTHRQIATTIRMPEDDALALRLGTAADYVTRSGAYARKVNSPKRTSSHIPALVAWEERIARTNRIVVGSLSFALMMASLGLIAVLIYLVMGI